MLSGMAFFLCLSSRNYTAAIILQISDGLTDTKSYKEIPDAGTSEALFIIAAGLVIVAVHAVVLLIGARLLRAPLFLVAAASQANIGGVASAPVVAEVYHPGLASVGLLLAILGNIVGTWLGILCAQLCRMV